MRRIVLLLPWLFAGAASAHDADVIYARLETGPGGRLTEVVTLTAGSLGLLAPVDVDGDGLVTQAELDARADSIRAGIWSDMPLSAGGQPCQRSDERALMDEGFITLTAGYTCEPGDLRQDFRLLRVLPANYRVVLGSQLDGERGRRFAQGVFTALEVPRPRVVTWWDEEVRARALRRGLSDNGSLDALALLLLLLVTASSWRWLCLRALLLLVGAASGLVLAPLPIASVGLVLAVPAAFLPATARGALVAGLLSLVAGLSVGARAGPLGVERPGWLLGLALILAVLGLVSLPAGRLLSRRPEQAFVIRAGLALVVVIAALGRFVR